MPSRRARWICGLLIVIGATPATSQPTVGGSPAPLAAFLRGDLGLGERETEQALAGEVLALTVDTNEPREIVVVGSVVIDVPADFFIEQVSDIEQFRRAGPALAVGRFSDPPRVGDLLPLELSREEIDTMRDCRVARCDFQMSATAITRLTQEVQWDRPYYAAQAMAIARAMLTDYVRTYAESGNAGLVEYHDQETPVAVRAELEDTLTRWPFLATHFPILNRHLLHFPDSDRSTIDDLLYWSLDGFGGLKPVLSVTHMSVHRPPAPSLVDAVIASKQIYASHYVDTSLGLTMLVDREGVSPQVQVLYLNRSRSGFLTRRIFGGLARTIVRRRVRSATRNYLERTKERVESAYAASKER